LQIFFLTAMHTCRRGTDASNSGLAGRVATAILGTEERMSNDGVTDLEIDCTLKMTPTIGVTGCFQTNNRLSGPARGGGELNRAAGTAACGGTSGGGGGPERRFGGLACWVCVVPWILLVLGGMEGVEGYQVPTCTLCPEWTDCCPEWTYSGQDLCFSADLYTNCPLKQQVDACYYGHDNMCTQSAGPIKDWDTSLVTDMRKIFGGEFHLPGFNPNVSEWQVGNVTNMFESTFTLFPVSPRSGLFFSSSFGAGTDFMFEQ